MVLLSQRKISRDLILSLAASMATVFIILISVIYLFLSKNEKRIFEEKAHEYIDYLQESLVQPIWAFDDTTVKHICTSIFKNDPIVGLKVTDHQGGRLFEEKKDGHHDLLVRTGSISREGHHLGTVEVALTTRPYEEVTRYLFWGSILTILLALAVMAGVTHISLKVFLGRPLQSLQARIDRLAEGDYEFDPKPIRQVEIQAIISKFNEMARKVQSREVSLAELNAKLQEEIRERERSEQELRASEERFRTYFEHSLLPMAITSPEKGWLQVNDRLIDLFGYSGEELRRMTWAELTHPEDLELDVLQFERMLSGEIDGYSLEKRFVRKDRVIVDTILSVRVVRRRDESPDYCLAQLQDITELRTAHQRLFDIIEFLPDATFVIDDRKRVIAWNKAIEDMTGVKKEDILGHGEYAYASPFYGIKRPILIDLLNQPHADSEATYGDVTRVGDHLYAEGFFPQLYHGRGAHLWGVAAPLWDREGQRVGAIEVLRDITDMKLAEDEMHRLRNYLSSIINAMPSLLIGLSRDQRVTLWNAAAEEATGLSAAAAQGRLFQEVIPSLAEYEDKVERAMRSGQVQIEAKVGRKINGESRYQDVTIYPLVSSGGEGVVIRVDDVTERVRIEEMMVQSEKMLSVGGLAAGMAHEINNPLGVILQASQNLLRRISSDLPTNLRVAEECGTSLGSLLRYLERREILRFLEDIRQSGQRAADIVRNMLSFSRMPEGGGSPTDLVELLDRTVSLAASDYDLNKRHDFRQIEIVREYHPEVPRVVCQASKIQQVFLNILRNGAEAVMTARELGRLPRLVLRVIRDREAVRVEIEDNGPGMDETARRRVFEPFFTTKPPGAGTGLGLSVSYFIVVEDHGGSMAVETSHGGGARFIIHLPVGGKGE